MISASFVWFILKAFHIWIFSKLVSMVGFAFCVDDSIGVVSFYLEMENNDHFIILFLGCWVNGIGNKVGILVLLENWIEFIGFLVVIRQYFFVLITICIMWRQFCLLVKWTYRLMYFFWQFWIVLYHCSCNLLLADSCTMNDILFY